ncbi:hypothetical protein [uncultured Eubacterium sp.]|uniref:hypothetical protein n=1 Tax=uncultured Eubacterium sp. TaxID=165185 RepID=UPI0025E5DC54|nr:hypothetical protein [uncultured Eubacterium sp.]
MINQERVREMTRMAMLENGSGERELKISTYRRVDYVILQMVKGFVLGTICFLGVLMLWVCSKWDDFNQYFANVNYGVLIKEIIVIYLIFLACYLVICALVAVHRHKQCRDRRDLYLHYLHRLNKSYAAEEKENTQEE